MARSKTPKTNPYADAPYQVGKGKPPQHTRFQKGQSGNRRGRPKKPSLHEQMQAGMRDALGELVTVRLNNGETRQVTALEAAFLKVRNEVLQSGNVNKLDKLLKMAREHGVLVPEEVQRQGVLVVPARSASAEEWEATYGRENRENSARFAKDIAELTQPPVQPAAAAAPAPPQAPHRRIEVPVLPTVRREDKA
ncbi:MAG TPA: DUF5681 domain-containing protein [Microvirga sp.]